MPLRSFARVKQEPSDASVTAATRRVLELVHSSCGSWRFPENVNHAFATAGLARAAELIEDALRLAQHPPTAGANILVRSAFECWLVSVWALFGGDDALLGIEKERVRAEMLLATTVGLDQKTIDYIADQRHDLAEVTRELLGTAAPSSVKFEQMARTLPPLIKEQTAEHEEVDMLATYNLLYRSHSTNDAHPWKPVGQYLQESGLGLRVESPGPWQNPTISAALMTMYLGVLGRWIEQARGGDGESWDQAVSDLQRLLSPASGQRDVRR